MRTRTPLLMAGVAAVALAASGALAAETKKGARAPVPVRPNLVVAQNVTQPSANAASTSDLAMRVQALEDALAARDERGRAYRTRLSTL